MDGRHTLRHCGPARQVRPIIRGGDTLVRRGDCDWADGTGSRGTLFGALAILLFLALSGCGFQPIYGEGTAASAARGQIAVEEIGGPMGFEMRRRLTERLGPGGDGPYRLSADINTTSEGLAVTQTAEITRYNLTGTARYVLRNGAGVPVLTGDVRAFSAYSATDEPYATRVAERDARIRLATSLADQIATRISASADGWLR